MVVGGAGFVGGFLVDELEAQGADVVIFDIRPVTRPERKKGSTISVVGDLCNIEHLLPVFQNAAVIFNVASPPPELNDRKLFYRVNVNGTSTIIEACKQAKVMRLVLVSSASVVYEGVDLENGDETTPYAKHPQDEYTETKIIQEKLVLESNSDKLMTVAIRPHYIYGPNDQAITTMVKVGRSGKLKFMIGNGKNIVSVTFVKNVVHALILASKQLGPGAIINGKAYHVDDGQHIGFWEFTGDVLQMYKLPRPSIPTPYYLILGLTIVFSFILRLLAPIIGPVKTTFTPSRIRLAGTHHYYSSAKAKAELNYQPLYTTKQGLEYTRQNTRL